MRMSRDSAWDSCRAGSPSARRSPGGYASSPSTAPRAKGDLHVAWRPGQEGRALKWFVKRLEDPLVSAALLS